MENFNSENRIVDMEKLIKTPKYIIKKITKGGILYFSECTKSEAKAMIEYGHYSHKFNDKFGAINVGVWKDGRLLGVASYGSLLNPKSCYKFSNRYNEGNIIELNRMCVSDELGKNTETMLLSASIKIIKELYPDIKLIQSFSDGRVGCGIMYQAANFEYYGSFKSVFYRNIDTNEIYHKMLLTNTKSKNYFNRVMMLVTGKLEEVSVETYRYIYKLYNDSECLLKKKEYPKNEAKFEITNSYKHLYKSLAKLYLFCSRQNNKYNGVNAKSLIEGFLRKNNIENEVMDIVEEILFVQGGNYEQN